MKYRYRIFEIVQHLKPFFSAMTNILAISIFRSTSIHLLLVNCISRFKNDVRFIFTSGRLMSCLRYLCLFAYIVVSNTLCIFSPPFVYPMLPVSLDCPFLIATSVFSNVYLCQGLHTYNSLAYYCHSVQTC